MTFDYQPLTQPDILEVIADLSNDEVRTPPSVANAVLDLLPAEVWTDSTLRWLDPGVKTGVFLREITKRLLVGLAAEIPDEEKRLEHILKNQVFGIAITELTALMGRRTLYCSKDASSDNSIVNMGTASGNLWFERTRHLFAKGRCTVCGAAEDKFDSDTNENYAYAFIHDYGRLRYQEDQEMKFDIIVGNPPYQMEGGGGGTNATPLYDKFLTFAIALSPRYISMIIPSRWMSGGRGLDNFRDSMLKSGKFKRLVDYANATELFSGVEIKGGINYFLWDSEHEGTCETTLIREGISSVIANRNLDEFDVFVREVDALPILRKVLANSDSKFMDYVSGDTPFGLASNFRPKNQKKDKTHTLEVHYNVQGTRKIGFIERSAIGKNRHLIDEYKVFVPEAGSDGGATIPDVVLGKAFVGRPNSVCTQTYLCAGPFNSETEANAALSYIQTKFFRFLVSLRKNTQHAMRATYSWVPNQVWDREWTDAELYKKYGITKDEQIYIESMIKEMPA
jgi:site-specific DNA-methyltransferase (adenine-specific)